MTAISARGLIFKGALLAAGALAGLQGCSGCMERNRSPAQPSSAGAEDERVSEFPEKAAGGRGDLASGVRVRPAAVAGSWYYGEKEKLEPFLDELLQVAPAPAAPMDGARVIALVSPHAGFAFSGKAAAAGYRLLRGRRFHRVVVLAVSHHVPFHGASIADVTHYETPLGRIPLDMTAVARLRKDPLVSSVAEAHDREHSLEMQLPLLQRVLGSFQLVPLLLGRMNPGDHAALAASLAELVDSGTLVVASSDFTHRGPNYSYEVPAGEGKASVRERLKALDDGSEQRILKLDPAGLLTYAQSTGSTICGLNPVAVLLSLLTRFKGVSAQVAARYTSGDVTGDWSNTVTYIDVAFTGAFPHKSPLEQARSAGESSFPLDAADKALLLKLARDSLDASVKRRAYDPGPLKALKASDSLGRKAGAFVTLKCKLGSGATCTGKGDGLRGCIGTIVPAAPVSETVARRASSAALEDPRFPSAVSVAELPYITVEVSVLTPPRPVKGPGEIVIGRHGIILQSGGSSTTFLPQVAPEQGWDRDTTLRHLSAKAGLDDDAWKEAGTTFQVYEAIVFSEGDP